MQESLSNLEIILIKYYENWEIIKKGVPQTAKISKLEWIFSKFPSQLEISGEQLFGGTAREVLFIVYLDFYRAYMHKLEVDYNIKIMWPPRYFMCFSLLNYFSEMVWNADDIRRWYVSAPCFGIFFDSLYVESKILRVSLIFIQAILALFYTGSI